MNTQTTNNRVFHTVAKSAFSMCPSGTFAATLVSLAFLGEHSRVVKDNTGAEVSKTFEYVGLGFEILDKNTGELHTVVEECTLSLNPSSKFYSRIKALGGGKPITDGQSFDVLLGKFARVEITHRLGKGKDGSNRLFANITAVSPLEPNQYPESSTTKPVYYDVLTHDAEAFARLNKKHQTIVTKRNGSVQQAA